MKISEAKAYADMIALVQFGSVGGGTGKPPTQAQSNASSAMNSLDIMDQLLSQGGTGLLVKGKLPFNAGSTEAQVYETATTNVVDILARMRTGAVISADEEKMYRRLIPKITDTDETRLYKISQLRDIFGSMAQGVSDPQQDLLAQLAGQQ